MLTTAFATVCGVAIGVWLFLGTVDAFVEKRASGKLDRELRREQTQSAINDAHAKATVERLRAQRNMLLKAADDARSALLEVQLEARAREEQIRRQVRDSGFGAL